MFYHRPHHPALGDNSDNMYRLSRLMSTSSLKDSISTEYALEVMNTEF